MVEINAYSISIHAPHAGRDEFNRKFERGHIIFQSTRPMRGATAVLADVVAHFLISIHAPHAGRDG